MTALQLDLFPNTSKQEIIQGDCLEVMRKMEANSIDFIVTDPPYGVSFMGKSWDRGIPSIEHWQEILRIVKPGGHICAAGLPRMMHRLISLIEDAGWEIRDLIMHLFGSGFPKSLNVSKAIDKAKGFEREKIERIRCDGKLAGGKIADGFINGVSDPGLCSSNIPISDLAKTFDGYGTALKPAWEGWCLAMKPLEGTFAQNAEKWGVAGINIDESRIGTEDIKTCGGNKFPALYGEFKEAKESIHIGRWPANLILSEEAAEELDQMTGNNVSRFFYCAKASSSERNRGLESLPLKDSVYSANAKNGEGLRVSDSKISHQNNHPTVKPISLMKYILKLIAPPGNPVCLDPFCGSGSTLVAAKELGISCIGIEKEEEYCEIARKRVEAA